MSLLTMIIEHENEFQIRQILSDQHCASGVLNYKSGTFNHYLHLIKIIKAKHS